MSGRDGLDFYLKAADLADENNAAGQAHDLVWKHLTEEWGSVRVLRDAARRRSLRGSPCSLWNQCLVVRHRRIHCPDHHWLGCGGEGKMRTLFQFSGIYLASWIIFGVLVIALCYWLGKRSK